jgi:hypothetical protein
MRRVYASSEVNSRSIAATHTSQWLRQSDGKDSMPSRYLVRRFSPHGFSVSYLMSQKCFQNQLLDFAGLLCTAGLHETRYPHCLWFSDVLATAVLEEASSWLPPGMHRLVLLRYSVPHLPAASFLSLLRQIACLVKSTLQEGSVCQVEVPGTVKAS